MGLDNPIHIAFLLILLLLVFGAKRLPEMGKSLGHGMRGFKDALSGENHEQPTPVAVQPALVVPHQDVTPITQAQVVAEPIGREKLPA